MAEDARGARVIFVVDIEGADSEGWRRACGTSELSFPLGVFAVTNPVRATGIYYFPADLEGHATRVSAEGLRRTDPAYLERAILPFADWRRAQRPDEWLDAIYATLVDASLRGYPLWLADSEACAERSEEQHAALGAWMQREVAELRVELPPRATESAASDVLDALLERLSRRDAIDDALVDRLAEAHPVLVEERALRDS